MIYFAFQVFLPYSETTDIEWPLLNHSVKYEFLNFIKIYSLQSPVSLFDKAHPTSLKQQHLLKNLKTLGAIQYLF